jgi:hypothetical protein
VRGHVERLAEDLAGLDVDPGDLERTVTEELARILPAADTPAPRGLR